MYVTFILVSGADPEQVDFVPVGEPEYDEVIEEYKEKIFAQEEAQEPVGTDLADPAPAQEFQSILTQSWSQPNHITDKAKNITAKLKVLRKRLKEWQASMTNLKTLISNVRIVILFLEVLEDYIDLSLAEWNFRKILENHLLNLLEKQNVYWKQRGNIKWVQLRDAGTHFFHANATLRHRNKLINELTSDEEITVTNHNDKDKILWNEFRQRLGVTEFSGFTMQPENLITTSSQLQHLEEHFTLEEIDSVIRALPNNKSPGPDGFNNEFIKAAWPIIKQDFYDLCHSFYSDDVCLGSINSSYITLIPKVDNPKYVGDFRPISLLNTSVKLLTKILANTLQSSVIPLIHRNQYGFIRTRTIKTAWYGHLNIYISATILRKKLSFLSLILRIPLIKLSTKQ
ncbi:uncharacterized protein [Miscanthus floridulus]|uniref:uncharacterized protein n=1 Tax=Miscanthus floridulus TaxID=154761 RepID=UPI0034578368